MRSAAAAGVTGEVYLKRAPVATPEGPPFPPKPHRVVPPEFIAKAWVRSVTMRGGEIGHLEYRVLFELVSHFNNRTHVGYPSKERLAMLCNASPRTVQRALQRLLEFSLPGAEHSEAPISQTLRGPRRTPLYGFTAWAYSCLPAAVFRPAETDPATVGEGTGHAASVALSGGASPTPTESSGTASETSSVGQGDNRGGAYKDGTLFLQNSLSETREGGTPDDAAREQIVARCVNYRYLHAEISPGPFERQHDASHVRARLADGLTEADLQAAVRGVLVDEYAQQRRKTRCVYWVWGRAELTLELARKAPPPPAWEQAGVTREAWEAEKASLVAEEEARTTARTAEAWASIERWRREDEAKKREALTDAPPAIPAPLAPASPSKAVGVREGMTLMRQMLGEMGMRL